MPITSPGVIIRQVALQTKRLSRRVLEAFNRFLAGSSAVATPAVHRASRSSRGGGRESGVGSYARLSAWRTRRICPHQCDQAVGQRASPIEVVVTAVELLVVHLVAFREQHVAHVAARFEDRATIAA